MSGTFNEIDVPPTLVSFAVDVAKKQDIITPELKSAGDKLVVFDLPRDAYDLPDYAKVMELYSGIARLIADKVIVAAYALYSKGIAAAAAKMAFGNKMGVAFDSAIEADALFANAMGSIIAEVPADKLDVLAACGVAYRTVAAVLGENEGFVYQDVTVTMDEALKAWTSKLEKVFPTKAVKGSDAIETKLYEAKDIYVCRNKVAKPTVFIPVFPGTNCEYDSTIAFERAGASVVTSVFRKAFERAGADVVTKVFKNRSASDIRQSVEVFEQAIGQAQIIMFPGGFSAGDEPDGSAKFFATAFQNEKLREAVNRLLNERDGLALGICNGFQAMIKLGLVPYGEIVGQKEDSPTLTYNTIGRHISKMVYTKVVSNKSPWLQNAELGGVYTNPVSHGEGLFVAGREWLERLFANGQVAAQYADMDGNVSMDEEWNVNGSYAAIEGITSLDGRCFGKMAHVERRGDGVAVNIYGEQDLRIFESGVEYFR